jgi:hypothetical protein
MSGDSVPRSALSDEQRPEYRIRLAEALRAVDQYTGTERSNQTLLGVLGRFEQWLIEALNLPAGRAVSAEIQTALWQREHAADAETQTIDQMIDHAIRRLTQLLAADLEPWRIAEALGVVYEHRGRILSPAGSGDIQTGSGAGWESTRLEPRIQHLITELQQAGIFLDDLIIRDGITARGAMREQSYTLIEIPRLDWGEVYVCNQVGEGTRVSLLQQGVETYEEREKGELDQLPGISRVVCQNFRQWSDAVIHRLTDGNAEPPKIDVPLLEAVRRFFKRQFTAEQWLSQPPEAMMTLEVLGEPLPSLIERICGERLQSTSADQLMWGGRFFGFGNEHILSAQEQVWNPALPIAEFESVRSRLTREYPTPDSFVAALQDPEQQERLFQLMYVSGVSMHVLQSTDARGEFFRWMYGCTVNETTKQDSQWHETIGEKYGSTSVRGIHGSIEENERLVQRGLPSLRCIRKERQKAEYLQFSIGEALSTAARLCAEKGYPVPETASLTLLSDTELGTSLAITAEALEGVVRYRIQQGVTEAGSVFALLQSLRVILTQLQKKLTTAEQSLMVGHIAQVQRSNPDQSVTMLTPLVAVPGLELTLPEGRLLQILLNEGRDLPYWFTARIIDHPAQTSEPAYHGTVEAVARSLALKLESMQLGSVICSRGGRYAFTADHRARYSGVVH